jgi:uncharacterized membrane protein
MQEKTPSPVITNDTLRITKEFKGIYMDNGSEIFIDCEDPGTPFHIVDNEKRLNSELKKILPNAYEGEGIFTHIQAEVSKSEDPKFAGDLTLKQIIKAEQKGYQNTCIPYEFWCIGNEPFWQMQISKTENLIDLYLPMEQKSIHFAYFAPQEKNGEFIYRASSKDQNITIKIKKEKCSDGMSEKQFQYSASISFNGNDFKGCAVKFGELPANP